MKTRLLSTSLLLLLLPFSFADTPKGNEPSRTLHVVGTGHLDTQWRWTIQKTITDYLPNTLKLNLDYFNKYPDYVFSFEGAFRYMLIKEYYPELYAQMKQRIKEGRWRLAGSWLDAVDVNMPSPEALIRQNLYGNGCFQKEFGKTSVDVYLPDCFGFSYALPSIAVHCGLKGFVTQKLLPYGSAYGGVPFNIGQWEGVDGSILPSVLEPGRYRHDVGTDWYKADWLIKRIDDLGAKSGLYLDYQMHGMGDIGDGPTKRSMDNLEACMKANGPIKVLSKGSDDLFCELKPDQIKKLPLYKGELLMATHGTGCYTTQSEVKQLNFQNEAEADSAERAAVLASLFGMPYPQQTLTDAWIRFLWHGFHDDLTGTSIPAAYEFTKRDQRLSVAQFNNVTQDSIKAIVSLCDTQVKGYPVAVFNPLPYSRNDIAYGTVNLQTGDQGKYVRVYDRAGIEVPSSTTYILPGSYAIFSFIPRNLGNGIAIYDVRLSNEPYQSRDLAVTDRTIENSRYKVTVNENGDMSSIIDKKSSKELLKSPIRLALLDDKPKRYASWEMTYEDVSATPREYVKASSPAEIVKSSNGPLEVSLYILRKAAGSTFLQTITLREGSDRVAVNNTIDWQTRGAMLKAEFPLATGNPLATYDLGLGTIQRGNNKPNLYEVPAQQWADLTQADGKYGVSIVTVGKYGWDKPNDDTLRLTLVRNGRVKESDYQYNNDIGKHNFSFAIYGHEGDWREGTVRVADRGRQPITTIVVDKHPGKIQSPISFIQCDDPRVSIKAIKKAENGNDLVIRVFESTGNPVQNAKIAFGTKVLGVRELNGFETPLAKPTLPLKSGGKDLVFDMKPYRPRTFAVRLAPIMDAKPVTVPIALPYDCDMVTNKGEKSDTDTIPAEIWPKQVQVGEAFVSLAPSNGMNAVKCQGQKITVPENSKLVIVAQSIDGSRMGNLIIGENTFAIWFHDWLAKAASFETEDWFMRPTAWIGTHRHDPNGADRPYEFCYLYRYEVKVPKGVNTITLPFDSRIRIYGMTAVKKP